jgi:hypothetical protein
LIYFSTPYSFKKKLLEAIDQEFSRVPRPTDWLVIMDGDIMFFSSNFGDIIWQYIEEYPNTGLFTCYASRCHYKWQLPDIAQPNNPDILVHQKIATTLLENNHLSVETIKSRIAGHLMVIQKKTWMQIFPTVRAAATQKNILGVDTKISNAVLSLRKEILLMKGVYVLHYLRMATGQNPNII